MATAQKLGITDVLHVLADVYGLDFEVTKDEARFLCPNPKHQDTKPSTDCNLKTGLWSCFSCGAKGDLVGLGIYVLKGVVPSSLKLFEREQLREEIIELLKPGSPEQVATGIQQKIKHARDEREASVRPAVRRSTGRLPSPSDYDSSPLTYMRRRGFDRATCRQYGVRFAPEETLTKDDGDTFNIKDSIAVPIRDREQRLISWMYRKTDTSLDWQPRYLYTPGFDLAASWFGLHLHVDEPTIHVVEGPLDSMWLTQHGYPAVAMMGNNHSNPRKFRQLHDFKKVVVVPDYDSGGAFMAERVGSLLRGRVPVFVCRWPKAVVRRTGEEKPDPQDIKVARDIDLVVSRAIPWHVWCLRQGLTTRGE